jgi:hypothetical protein
VTRLFRVQMTVKLELNLMCFRTVLPTPVRFRVDPATGQVEMDDPRDLFTEENFVKFKCDWSQKVNTAFFRGTATGGGVTRETNQRLQCSAMSYEWASDPK